MSDDTDRDLRESIGAFEAALHADEIVLPKPRVRKILLALDQSNQDATAESLAVAIAERHEAVIHMTYAYEGDVDDAKERYLGERRAEIAQRLHEERTTASRSSEEAPYEQIIDVLVTERCDFMVVASPYLDDLRALGSESIGTNLEMLLHRTPVPVLVVRQPKEDASAVFRRVLLPVAIHVEENAKAAGWALELIAAEGHLRMLAVVDAEVLEGAAHLLDKDFDARSVDESTLRALESREHAGLVAALQKRAADEKLACRFGFRVGDPVSVVVHDAGEADTLIVTGCPKERQTTAFERVQALVRASGHPVLVV